MKREVMNRLARQRRGKVGDAMLGKGWAMHGRAGQRQGGASKGLVRQSKGMVRKCWARPKLGKGKAVQSLACLSRAMQRQSQARPCDTQQSEGIVWLGSAGQGKGRAVPGIATKAQQSPAKAERGTSLYGIAKVRQRVA